MTSVKFAVLVDNCVWRRSLFAEHGLSLYIESCGRRILFDTGQSGMFLKNAEFMNIPLNLVDSCVISHSHYDHAGGVLYFAHETDFGTIDFFVPPGFFNPVYSKHKGKYRFSGNELKEETLPSSLKIKKIDRTTEISENMTLIHSRTSAADYYIKKDVPIHLEELSLLCGKVLFTGCSHSGIVEIVRTARKVSPVETVAGGFHLISENSDKIAEIANQLKDSGVKNVMASHCSGSETAHIFRREGLEACSTFTGMSMTL
ncbi:MAG: MBL fold metallo-hydrolase [Candidatus Delongbacteria bacterium]